MTRVPGYFDRLIDAFQRGHVGRPVHLGLWDSPPAWLAGSGDVPPDFLEFVRAQQRLDEVVIATGSFQDGQRVVDAGCGFGSTIEALAARFDRMQLTGVNVDPRQLALCGSVTGRGNAVRWIEADATALPLEARSVDRLLSVEAMFHFPSRRRFFAEAARVLAPGGVMVVTDIVLRPEAVGDPSFSGIARALLAGYGPWPDLEGRDSDHATLAAAAGLALTSRRDVTEETWPSHRFTAPPELPDLLDLRTVEDPSLGAALALRRLHRQRSLTYLVLRFENPATSQIL